MRALEQATTRNFLVVNDINLVWAVIAKSEQGWRVFSNNAARKNGRTHSATPELAAKKYFKRSVEFVYLPEEKS